jgi:membrane-associated protease RseP (regulator of RpoE activity)
MRNLVDCPGSQRGQWNFSLWGVPVHVQFWFWLSVLIIGGEQPAPRLAIWAAVCFCSILLHELGHVFAFRVFGERAEVILYGWGGLAVPRGEVHGTFARFVVSLAGPAAGFALAGLTLVLAMLIGAKMHIMFHMMLPTVSVWPKAGSSAYLQPSATYAYIALNDLLYINFYWGLVNLLPIYPLDGGHAARAVFEQYDPYRGRKKSLMLSAVLAAIVAIWGLTQHSTYLFLLFGILAVSSIQALEAEREWLPRQPYGHRR